MTIANAALRLSLVVDNPQALQLGSRPTHAFGAEGGTIGSQGDSWTLIDRAGRIKPRHCELRHRDGGFVIIDRSGETFVNDQSRALGSNTCALLSDGDQLRIGPYRISVRLGGHEPHLHEPGLDLAVRDDTGQLVADFEDALPEAEPEGAEAESLPAGWSDFQALGEPPHHQGLLDPLKALDACLRDTASLDPSHYGQTPLAAQADVAATRSEAVYGAPKHDPGEPRMLDQEIPSPIAREWLQRQLASNADPASLLEPLVEGIGAPLAIRDGEEAYGLLNEAGRALAALIQGLCALNVADPDAPSRISPAGRTLQPIEDNPLRLGQGYPDTVRALFSSERSVVHLSPSAAVEESLEQIRRQQAAMHQAISAGLAALLQAFSPEQLEQRFQRYRRVRSTDLPANDWAWQMYGHYYEELTSGRQQGFDKLFWEVFEQAFDQALRAEA
ncbi:type VI secretion system-associated FHA domain protein TagH [Pseudomonas wadenswilerensis]